MKKIFFVIFIFIISILQSCDCYLGWGYSTISKSYYPQKSWSDTTLYYRNMQKIGNTHHEIIPDSNDIKIYLFNSKIITQRDSLNLNPVNWFPMVNCAFGAGTGFCLHSWYIKSKKKDLVFELGLYSDGFSISSVKVINSNQVVKVIGAYELCDMKRSDRKKIKREFIGRFESEILPIMKPYFETIK